MGGNDYRADRFASGGTSRTITESISGTTDQALYQSERFGDYTYEIPVTNATYNVDLHFAETWWDTAGERSFNVIVEGQEVLSDVDLFSLAGLHGAYDHTVEGVTVADESLTIEIETVLDNGSLAGIGLFSSTGEFVEPPEPEPGQPGTSSAEDEGADCPVTSPSGSNGGSANALPDPFTKWDGSRVQTMEDWRCRRSELRRELEQRILGEKAPPPQSVSGSITNSGYQVSVQNGGSSTSFSGTISLPSGGSPPYPAVITVGGFGGLDSSILSSEGVANISYDAYEIASESGGDYTTGKYYTVNPDQRGNTGALAAWAWGVSRIIDVMEQNPGVIDPTRVAITGCSRFGKAAFVIGAFDQRIALGVPFEPGTGGPAPLRALSQYGGQTLGSANGEASWFGPMAQQFNAGSSPVDMHDVVAMYAPRGLFIMDNPHIDHLSYKANLLGAAAGYEVYKAMGADDALWYHSNTSNGTHCQFRSEHAAPLRAMIQKFLKGNNSVETGGITRHSNQGDVNVGNWINWTTPNISN